MTAVNRVCSHPDDHQGLAHLTTRSEVPAVPRTAGTCIKTWVVRDEAACDGLARREWRGKACVAPACRAWLGLIRLVAWRDVCRCNDRTSGVGVRNHGT